MTEQIEVKRDGESFTVKMTPEAFYRYLEQMLDQGAVISTEGNGESKRKRGRPAKSLRTSKESEEWILAQCLWMN